MAKRTFYVTTPIYYTTEPPHIGHAYTTIAADVIARWHRMLGKNVMFLTGSDEHGQKIEKAALKSGKTPKQFVDEVTEKYRQAWKILNISYDRFIRTTDKSHVDVVLKIFEKLLRKGDIYKGTYEGWYCMPDESFWTDFQLANGKCPDCGRDVEKIKEESYFFRLSRYEKKLLNHIEHNPNFIQPQSRKNEVINFIKQGLKDISISRATTKWGIAIPGDERHVLYVWIDALSNYISALGWPDGKDFKIFWPTDIHLMGKEIVRFHAIIWPAILMALGIKLPKMVFGHGWWTVEGEKMSKSRGNVIDPLKLAEIYGVDTIRYFLLREITFGEDGNFSYAALNARHNNELADMLGNLLNRVLILNEKNFNGIVPKKEKIEKIDEQLIDKIEHLRIHVGAALDALQFSIALDEIMKVVAAANKYINDTKPWEIKDKKRISTILYVSLETLRVLATILYPFLPHTAEKIISQLGIENYEFTAKNLRFGSKISGWKKTNRGEILFKKIEMQKQDVTGGYQSNKQMDIDIIDFRKVDMRVAEIKRVEDVPASDKLYKLVVDVGGQEKQLVAGIKKHYTARELFGKKIVIVNNLKPAVIKGIKSEGMLLAAGEGDVLVVPNKDVKNGTKIL